MAVPISEIKNPNILRIRLENDKLDKDETEKRRASVRTRETFDPAYCYIKRSKYLDEYEGDTGCF